MQITLTNSAKKYLTSLINHTNKLNKINFRISLFKAFTPEVTIKFEYCFPKEQKASDLEINYENFIIFIDPNAEKALLNAVIDYRANNTAEEPKLHINAPCLKDFAAKPNNEIENLFIKISNFLEQEVNVILSKHKGSVKLVNVSNLSNNEIAVELEFSGGCIGCSMVNLTLKYNVEKSLKQKFEQIKIIKDVTDHSLGKVPYYQ